MDIGQVLYSVISLPGVIAGIGVAILYLYATPGPVDAEGKRQLATIPGTIWARLQPLVGPTAAFLSTIAVEWYQTHPELGNVKGLLPADVVRGVTTAFGCEYFFRIYYKTIKGV